jgi:hypothetical protein
VLTFLSVSILCTLNEIARDVEDPFHYDPNQLPLPQMQYKLNERLLAVSKTRRPIAFTDDRCLEPPHFMPSGMVRYLFLLPQLPGVHAWNKPRGTLVLALRTRSRRGALPRAL